MAGRDERGRIEKDFREFRESIGEIRARGPPAGAQANLARAEEYLRDAEYFLAQGDAFSAWGAINYAHGILDAVRSGMGLECYGALA